jgi:hypothetical protein
VRPMGQVAVAALVAPTKSMSILSICAIQQAYDVDDGG